MRRVVMGEGRDGKSVVLSDDKAFRRTEFECRSGKWSFMTEVWATDETPVVPVGDEADPTLGMASIIPPPGGTRCRVLVWPGAKEMADIEKWVNDRGSNFRDEFHKQSPGIEGSTDSRTGMHYTDTIDYGYFVSGRIDLELDDGKIINFKAGDSYVLKGTGHAWHNPYDEPCVWIVFMVGGSRKA